VGEGEGEGEGRGRRGLTATEIYEVLQVLYACLEACVYLLSTNVFYRAGFRSHPLEGCLGDWSFWVSTCGSRGGFNAGGLLDLN
jgi:hypothetical protein